MLRTLLAWLQTPVFGYASPAQDCVDSDADVEEISNLAAPARAQAIAQPVRVTSFAGQVYVYDAAATLGDGESSTATVYAGWVGDVGGREVAIKVEDVNVQVYNDQQIWRRLQNSGGFVGLAKLIDYLPAYGDNTRFVMVTERLGCSLHALRAERGALPPSAMPAVAHQALCMLREMHVRGFVHRDVKPANLLVGRGASRKTLFVVDFGTTQPYPPIQRGQDPSGTLMYLPRGAALG